MAVPNTVVNAELAPVHVFPNVPEREEATAVGITTAAAFPTLVLIACGRQFDNSVETDEDIIEGIACPTEREMPFPIELRVVLEKDAVEMPVPTVFTMLSTLELIVCDMTYEIDGGREPAIDEPIAEFIAFSMLQVNDEENEFPNVEAIAEGSVDEKPFENPEYNDDCSDVERLLSIAEPKDGPILEEIEGPMNEERVELNDEDITGGNDVEKEL